MRKSFILAAVLALGGCGYVDSYEEAVYDREPIYCYQSLAGVECFKEPNPTDEKRLVNYFGPHPSRYARAERVEPKLVAPPPVAFWVKDPEPVPEPLRAADAAAAAANGALKEGGKEAPREGSKEADLARELEAMKISDPQPPASKPAPKKDGAAQ